MRRHTLSAVLTVAALSWAGTAHGIALDKSSKVTVTLASNLSVDLYSEEGRENRYYYVPSRVRVAAGGDGEPQITVLTYVSDEAEGASGGTFNALVTWGLTAAEEDELRNKLRSLESGAVLAGAAPLETVEEGPSVHVLVALGGGEQVAWSGVAPLQAGGRAALAANLSPTGAHLLDAGISEGNLAGISVEMNFLLPFQVDIGSCEVRIDWTSINRDLESLAYEGVQENTSWWDDLWNTSVETESVRLTGIRRSIDRGHITNTCDYDRATPEQQEFFENAIAAFLTAKLGATEEAREAARQAAEEGEGEDDEEDEDLPRNPGREQYYYNYTKNLFQSHSGTETLRIDRSFVLREPAPPVIGNVKEWVTGHESSEGVRIRSVNLSASEFAKVTVDFALGATAQEMFGLREGSESQLNSVVVTLRKKRTAAGDFTGDFLDSVTFTRKDVTDGNTVHTFEYARGSEADPLEYEYSVTWSYVGRRGQEGPFVRSDVGSHTLEPDAQKAPVQFRAIGSDLTESGILGVAAHIKHEFLGQERTSYLNVFPDETSASSVLFVDQDVPHIAVRRVFTHQEHGELATPWELVSVPHSGIVVVHTLIPDELRSQDAEFIEEAQAAVIAAADKKLDEVLKEFGKL
jgi:hypothetical protein